MTQTNRWSQHRGPAQDADRGQSRSASSGVGQMLKVKEFAVGSLLKHRKQFVPSDSGYKRDIQKQTKPQYGVQRLVQSGDEEVGGLTIVLSAAWACDV